jgi:hypothetical protein
VERLKSSFPAALVVVLGIAGATLVLIQTNGLGPGVTTDSVAFLSAADSFFSSGRFAMYDGTPLLQWPPGYAAALALVRTGGVDALRAAQVVNAVCFGLVIALTGIWLLRRLDSKWFAVVTAAALFVSIPLLNVATLALSEMLFTVFVILYLATLERAHRTERLADAMIAGALVALATLTRYAGLGLGIGGAIVLGGLRPNRSSVKRVAAFSVAALAPVLAWLARNYALGGVTGGSGLDEPLTTPAESIVLAIDAVATTVLPPHVPLGARVAMTAVAAALLTAVLLQAYRGGGVKQRNLARSAGVLGAVLLGYCVFWLACNFAGVSDVSQRIFAPMYPALLALLMIGVDSHYSAERRQRRWVARVAALTIATVTLLYPSWYSWNMTRYARSVGGGGGYNTRAWRSSDLIQAVAALGGDAKLISNAPGAVYLWSGRTARGFGARHYPPERDGFARGLQRFERQLKALGGAYVAVFDSSRVQYSYVYTQEQLSQVAPVQVVSTYSDGILYQTPPTESHRADGAR